MNHQKRAPLLYEINTRCWLRDLSVAAGAQMSLSSVPDTTVKGWARLGVTHIWLMGVWTTGPLSRAVYLQHANTRSHLDEMLPGWSDADVPGSPYAIAAYRVPESLGGDAGLAHFREQLRRHGLQLVLDFVPNHTGLDHPWIRKRSELFMPSHPEAAGSFLSETGNGPRWLAHGRDPYFPAWIDTAQLDFRNAATRAALIEELRDVAAKCDGVRCDMAMLMLNDVFAATWKEHAWTSAQPGGEFWSEAIHAVKEQRGDDFQFFAEAYWDLEPRLQSLGFDFTYNKRVLDHLVTRDYRGLSEQLTRQTHSHLSRSIFFLENHDEARITSRMSLPEHKAAALLIHALPGVALLHDGQLEGMVRHSPVQWSRRPSEVPSAEVAVMYANLLRARRESQTGDIAPQIHAREDGVVLIHWNGIKASEMAVTNLSRESRRMLFPERHGGRVWHDWLTARDVIKPLESGELLTLDLEPYATHWFASAPRE